MASSVGIAGHPPSRPLTITHGIPERRAGPIVVASAPSRHPVRREGHSTDPADGPIPPPLCRSCSCGAPAPVRKPYSTPPVGPANHSFSFDQRGRPEALHTAMATAFFWPTSTTSRFQHGVVLGQHRDHHGRIFRALALVDRRGIGRHQRVQLAEAVDQIASLESRRQFAGVGVHIGDEADVTRP